MYIVQANKCSTLNVTCFLWGNGQYSWERSASFELCYSQQALKINLQFYYAASKLLSKILERGYEG